MKPSRRYSTDSPIIFEVNVMGYYDTRLEDKKVNDEKNRIKIEITEV